MPELSITIGTARVLPFSAVPTLAFPLQISNAKPGEEIHTIVLRSQIQIEVTRRGYSPQEQARMLDLFGQPERWGQTLRNLLWTHASVVVPGFDGASTVADLHVPCTFDFNVAATKYFDGLAEGEIPLLMLFSGSVFYATSSSPLQVAPISWELEARCKVPVQTWREMMSAYYPNCIWIHMHRDIFDRLNRFKTERGIPTWDQALDELLASEAMVRP